MNKEKLKDIFENMTPDEVQVSRLKRNILAHEKSELGNRRSMKAKIVWVATPTICLILAFVLFFTLPFGVKQSAFAIHLVAGESETKFQLENFSGSDSITHFVNYVDSRPSLRFFIDGDDIAKIEMTSEIEDLTATDWTETQHERYWNYEYFQPYSEEHGAYVLDKSLRYDQVLSMEFAEDFTEYERIWYSWSANRMHEWASENNYSRFLGVGMDIDDFQNLTEEEKLKLAAGDNQGIGHMQLDDYPDHLKTDRITITITDRQGKQTTKVIEINVDNNEYRQTVVTARLIH